MRFDTSEPDAVLQLIDQRNHDGVLEDADWARIWKSEGFRRLTQRETSVTKKAIDETRFQQFVLSDTVPGRAEDFRHVLDAWKRADLKSIENSQGFLTLA